MTLQVSMKSWHYRYQVRTHNFWGDATYPRLNPRDRTNLCSYMRGFVICSLLWTAAVLTIWLWGPVAAVYFPLRYLWRRYKASLPVLDCARATTNFGWCGGNVKKCGHCGQALCKHHMKQHRREINPRPMMKETVQGMLSLTWKYAKAKKHKICPVIEFVDPTAKEAITQNG